jgi:hypothetical protein
MNRLANTSCAAAIVAAVAAFGGAPVLAGDITAEWANNALTYVARTRQHCSGT